MVITRNRFCLKTGSVAALCCLFLAVADSQASKVVLDIKAGNPIDKPQKKAIKSNLPRGIAKSDIINAAGLDVGYDVQNDIYYVHKEIELGPKEIRTFAVEINDVWVITKEETAALRKRTADLTGKLSSRQKDFELAQGLQKEIEKTAAEIDASQAANSIKAGVKPPQHIRAYEADMAALRRLKRDIGKIENLALAAGIDTGGLVGDVSRSPLIGRRGSDLEPAKYKEAVIKVTVVNTSPTETRKIQVRRDLPPEIKSFDIINAGGLEIGSDSKSGLCYVHKSDVELAPSNSVTFAVRIRDKWNVNGPRMEMLLQNASNLASRISAKEKYDSIVTEVKALGEEVVKIRNTTGPRDLDDKYVDFYRRQSDQLDVVEQKLYRIEQILKPIEKTTKLGAQVKPPSTKTTWMIIYSIIGFLFVMSLLFFFRWYGKSDAEKMEGE